MTIPDDFVLRDGEDFNDLITRYWLGEGSADERARIELWFNEGPGRRDQFQRLYQGIEAGNWMPLSAEVTAERTVGILQRTRTPAVPDTPSRTHRPLFSYMRYAIVVVSVFVLGTVWQRLSSDTIQAASSSLYTTGNGERARVTLPDGTTALLNVASQLEVPLDYGRGNRTVKLTGEALFTVVHNQGAPFTVLTPHSRSRVLGTRFVVRQYQTDTAAIVAVKDGKVAVGSQVLTAGYETVVTVSGASRVYAAETKRFDIVRGVLSLDARPLVEAIPELNRWYNAEIRLGDSTLAGLGVVGEFETGSVSDLMWILQRTYHVRVVREGRVLTLYPRG